MKATITVFFLIAMLISNTQTFRHVYVKWVKDDFSVLDQFKEPINQKIEASKNIEELVVLYKGSDEAVRIYESSKGNKKINTYKMRSTEPYKTRWKIKSEINMREQDQKNLNKMKFYWVTGLLSVISGIVVFVAFNRWLGLSGVLVGFSEMLCWTSPLFHNRVFSSQFEALLNCKLTLSIVTWILIVALWLVADRRMSKDT